MPNTKHEKLVVAVSSRALFDLEAEHKIFEDEGIEAYRDYQVTVDDVLYREDDGILTCEHCHRIIYKM